MEQQVESTLTSDSTNPKRIDSLNNQNLDFDCCYRRELYIFYKEAW